MKARGNRVTAEYEEVDLAMCNGRPAQRRNRRRRAKVRTDRQVSTSADLQRVYESNPSCDGRNSR
jgi:hypothetical protein